MVPHTHTQQIYYIINILVIRNITSLYKLKMRQNLPFR